MKISVPSLAPAGTIALVAFEHCKANDQSMVVLDRNGLEGDILLDLIIVYSLY